MTERPTVIITRRLANGREREYNLWLTDVLGFLHAMPGYDGATLITSPDKRIRMMVIRFESPAAMALWEIAPRRRELINAANAFSTAELHVASGFETFFSVPGGRIAPPRWKLCVITIPLAYAFVNATLFVVSPFTQSWPFSLRLLPVVSIMTALLTYIGLPFVTKIFAFWLAPRIAPPAASRTTSVASTTT